MDSVTKIEDLLKQLEGLAEADARPFPYEECRRLQAAVTEPDAHLVPDLDGYLSELAGYRSWGRRILEWPDRKIETVEQRLHHSFFDRFPVYRQLEALLLSSEMADVSNALRNADRTRALLVELLSEVRNAREALRGGL